MNYRFSFLSNRSVTDRKGQVAIFIALIFQLLFLFFAMVINVGLLVHHKINLQNSVDLAAYYGAMKQAELMNAMGHMNYQIRQNYKLLTWRYRVMGIAGVHPEYAPRDGSPNSNHDGGGNRGAPIRGGEDYEGINSNLKDFYERPAFCINFKPFDEVPENENTCKAAMGQNIAALRVPPIIASFIGAAHTAVQVTNLSNASKQANCARAGPFNYVALARFIVGYNIDQGDRKSLMYKIANNMSASTDEFIDIEGESGRDGIRKTLDSNLTAANKATVKKFKIYNSLAHNDCKERGGTLPPKWLSEVVIFPRSTYMTCSGSGGNENHAVKNIDNRPASNPNFQDEGSLKGAIDYLEQYVANNSSSNIYRPSLGVEKNPWCMAYVGVTATTEPDIPFSLGKITLKATAFAKPFGGKIGPWYGKRWDPSAEESDGMGEDNRTDPRTPVRCKKGDFENCRVNDQDAVSTVNYSRFPGDPWGLMSRRVHGQYTKSIFDLGAPTFNTWEGIQYAASARPEKEWDLLSMSVGEADQKMRRLEVASVIPDLFDMTYYSIDPDFYRNYYVGRLEKYIQKNPIAISGGAQFVMRFDIGARTRGDTLISMGNRPSQAFNINDQLRLAESIGVQASETSAYGINWTEKLKYPILPKSENFAQVLTSWIPSPDLASYSLDTNRFGKCKSGFIDNDASTPGSCAQGGRTGFSVKLISSDYLLSDMKLGGEGAASAKIKNQPPKEFYE